MSDKVKYLDGFYEDWFLDYASYVILERAVPKQEDGLKPVQRRILHSMFEMHDNRFHKVANIIGHSMKYHPHGDASIGDALVNLTHRSLLIETQGNFGDIRTGDRAAAPRYIEAKLSNFAIDVAFNHRLTEYQDSYDGRNKEPVQLPMKFPLLLLNGTEGIAVGLSTKILPHNFNELIKASISILNNKSFKIFPDFQTGGSIDVDNYKKGKKGGKIRIRSTIEISGKDKLTIKSVPYSSNTTSLIDSIIKANDNGKIKIKNIEDNTAEEVDIAITLPKGISPTQTIDALYLFTQCEISISPNCCVIKNNTPVFSNINDLLIDSTYKTQKLLQSELELHKGDLDRRWHLLSLEKIFIEHKIYRLIEDAESWDVVVDIIIDALLPFESKLKTKISNDDIIYLTDLKIKRISKYDINKTKDKLLKLEHDLDEVINNINHIIDYTILFYERLLKKYGNDKNRKSKIEKFDIIKVKQAALTNKKLYINYDEGFLGFNLKNSALLCECSEFDDIIVFREDGTYLATKVGDKKFIGKNIIYAGLWKKNDRHMVYNVVYLNKDDKKTYIKRFSIESILKDKEYPISKNILNSKILYITGNPNSESEIIKINLHFKCAAKKKEFEYDFNDIIIKNRFSKGNILTKYPIRKIIQHQLGKSTFGGKKIWFDEAIGKLNFDGRGELLGRFEADDNILVVYKTGEYEVSSIDVSKRFNFSNIDILTKLNSETIITSLHYIGNKKSYFIKRFKIETNQLNKLFLFIDDSRGSKFIKSTDLLNPIFKFNYRLKSGEKKEKLIDIIDFIDIKGWKAIGNKLSDYLRMSSFDFYENSEREIASVLKKDIEDNFDDDSNNDENSELTLF
ncbi:DNA gyrase/topoisomerase IV subunit A [bacterium]|nr:DNA gyrase/topoisomerase IV subunit A [bacterium]